MSFVILFTFTTNAVKYICNCMANNPVESALRNPWVFNSPFFSSILCRILRRSHDSTNKNCQAGDIELAEFGHAKTDIGSAIINYSVGYDLKNKEPLFYEAYPGSIN